MLLYYFRLGLHSFRRNPVLTSVMVAAVALGIGASMTLFTIYRAVAGDPIPNKSAELFVPQIDNWGPKHRRYPDEAPQDQLSYRDAVALMQARAAPRQTALYQTRLALTPADPSLAPFRLRAIATYRDFFPMFDVPFKYGGAWTRANDENRADVAVISGKLDERLFGGGNSVGKTIRLDDRDYRVVGVLGNWHPYPLFYDTAVDAFLDVQDVFLPFTTAVEQQMPQDGNTSCAGKTPTGWQGLLSSECVWIEFWADLPTADQQQHYRDFLNHYAAEQRRLGRFHWPPLTRLRGLRDWLAWNQVVPDVLKVLVILAFAFLAAGLVNAMGLMLGKFMARAADIGVRRALGASRRQVFGQYLMEAAAIGLAGGVVGLGLTALGLAAMRGWFSVEVQTATHLDGSSAALTLALAVVATLVAGLYPVWRAMRMPPSLAIKAN